MSIQKLNQMLVWHMVSRWATGDQILFFRSRSGPNAGIAHGLALAQRRPNVFFFRSRSAPEIIICYNLCTYMCDAKHAFSKPMWTKYWYSTWSRLGPRETKPPSVEAHWPCETKFAGPPGQRRVRSRAPVLCSRVLVLRTTGLQYVVQLGHL